MSITVLSACYGQWDMIKRPPTQDGYNSTRWLLVTDEPDIEAPGWEVAYEPRPYLHPCLAAKMPKVRPDRYTDSDITIWVDASAILGPGFVRMCVQSLEGAPIAMFPHPMRTSLVAEVEASRALPKYADLQMEQQAALYLSQGYPDSWGMWATGCIVRQYDEFHRLLFRELGDWWLLEMVRWGFQDQLSFPYLLHKYDITPVPLADSIFTSPHIWFGSHGR